MRIEVIAQYQFISERMTYADIDTLYRRNVGELAFTSINIGSYFRVRHKSQKMRLYFMIDDGHTSNTVLFASGYTRSVQRIFR